ncbi:hypothetical protein XENOCAPTIV_003264, partial [Xenoophorus captivus]
GNGLGLSDFSRSRGAVAISGTTDAQQAAHISISQEKQLNSVCFTPLTQLKNDGDSKGDLTPHLDPIISGANMKDLWTNAGRPRPSDDDLKQSLWRVCSEFFSRPLTIAWGMRLFGLNPCSKPLTIHLVGAGHSETLAAKLTDYDELNNMFPGHQGIEIVMVGPEVVDSPILRPPLRAFGPKQRVYISAYKGLYHEFWEELMEKEEAAKPDLVVGFNPGKHI